jgi:hypothetical protein
LKGILSVSSDPAVRIGGVTTLLLLLLLPVLLLPLLLPPPQQLLVNAAAATITITGTWHTRKKMLVHGWCRAASLQGVAPMSASLILLQPSCCCGSKCYSNHAFMGSIAAQPQLTSHKQQQQQTIQLQVVLLSYCCWLYGELVTSR